MSTDRCLARLVPLYIPPQARRVIVLPVQVQDRDESVWQCKLRILVGGRVLMSLPVQMIEVIVEGASQRAVEASAEDILDCPHRGLANQRQGEPRIGEVRRKMCGSGFKECCRPTVVPLSPNCATLQSQLYYPPVGYCTHCGDKELIQVRHHKEGLVKMAHYQHGVVPREIDDYLQGGFKG